MILLTGGNARLLSGEKEEPDAEPEKEDGKDQLDPNKKTITGDAGSGRRFGILCFFFFFSVFRHIRMVFRRCFSGIRSGCAVFRR